MELKLTEIALNRSKNHGERTTDKGVQVGIFLLKIRWYFKLNRSKLFSFVVHHIFFRILGFHMTS